MLGAGARGEPGRGRRNPAAVGAAQGKPADAEYLEARRAAGEAGRAGASQAAVAAARARGRADRHGAVEGRRGAARLGVISRPGRPVLGWPASAGPVR
ncbi:hypothetical protein GCM10022380_49470 [Amycolatopsis tucumanensis]|uniref:Uncharacterized protein n=1 Tax=Amycolatopsis tucumanensis TaxID=401106 RepID=A0ABP7IR49_9PSEU